VYVKFGRIPQCWLYCVKEHTDNPQINQPIYTKCRYFSVKHIQFSVKNTFKAICFGSTEPSSGLFLRTDPYPIASTFGIPSVYSDGIFNPYPANVEKMVNF
jgi:hypothetical protein